MRVHHPGRGAMSAAGGDVASRVLCALIETRSLSLWGNATAPNNKTQLTVTEIIAPMIQLYCCILVLSADRLTCKANLLQQAPRGLSSHLTLLRVVYVCMCVRVRIHYVSLCFSDCNRRLIPFFFTLRFIIQFYIAVIWFQEYIRQSQSLPGLADNFTVLTWGQLLSDQQGDSGLDGGSSKQALLESDAQPLSYTSRAAQCKDCGFYWAAPRGKSLFVLRSSLQLHAKAVVANTCFPSHVSWLNKDYMYLIRITVSNDLNRQLILDYGAYGTYLYSVCVQQVSDCAHWYAVLTVWSGKGKLCSNLEVLLFFTWNSLILPERSHWHA